MISAREESLHNIGSVFALCNPLPPNKTQKTNKQTKRSRVVSAEEASGIFPLHVLLHIVLQTRLPVLSLAVARTWRWGGEGGGGCLCVNLIQVVKSC